MARERHLLYNPYFIYPFIVWVISGGIALLTQSKHDLFFSINAHYNDSADIFMFYATWLGQAETIIPALILLMLLPKFRNWWYFITATACNVIPLLAQHFIKTWLNAPRPILVYGNTETIHHLQQWPTLLRTSFPSGHSQGAFSFFCFLSLLLPARYRPYGFLFFIAAMIVCYSRIYLAAHFFADVYAGSILGTALTTIIFAYMDKHRSFFTVKRKA